MTEHTRRSDTPAEIPVHRADYTPTAFRVESVALEIRLDPVATRVRARLAVRRVTPGSLMLHHEALELAFLRIDGAEPEAGALVRHPGRIELGNLPECCTVETESVLAPRGNTELSGLYMSAGDYFTQCEAEGFRRITPFPDRPDVMSRYTVTLTADRTTCPVLLSNGNRVAAGENADGTHWACFEDPHPKPCYLFAVVAGRLVAVEDRFTTRSGREVSLAVWVRAGDEGSCGHALASLKKSMRWDEEVYGFEYDLDVFHIAAVADFNMGAMENKGLNVFNTRYVLARPETASDADYDAIEGVIAHEYFHNWTGNRVTCRDWFQLSLKEGLTVFRDQEFSADQGSRAVRRIADVRRLRAAQFPEDDGPLAHPVRPETYVRIDNFYTATIYQKGAEIVRMIRTLIGGAAPFRAGMDLYVRRHDNQAVTIEDFLRAMEDASGVDLAHLSHWYAQAGTPVLSVHERFDPDRRRYTLSLSQATAPTPGQPDKAALPITVLMGLLDESGREIPTRLVGESTPTHGTRLLLLDASEADYVFEDVAHRPTPSLMRGFSAPVRLSGLAATQLAFLAAHDTDPFVRWDSGQQYAIGVMLALVEEWQEGRPLKADARLLEAMDRATDSWAADPAFAAEALALPSEAYVGDQMQVLDASAVHAARRALQQAFGKRADARLRALLDTLADTDPDALDGVASGRRALAGQALAYLVAAAPDGAELAYTRYRTGRNFTERFGALALLCRLDCPEKDEALEDFRANWHADALMMDRWLAAQAASPTGDTPRRVRELYRASSFDMRAPNAVRALVGTFSANQLHFHAGDGSGYRFLGDVVRTLDPVNGQIAARLVAPLGMWRRLDNARAAMVRDVLDEILALPGLSAGTREMASRAR